MRFQTIVAKLLISGIVFVPLTGWNQETERSTLHAGSAVVVNGLDEYTIRILCDDRLRPELGFSTEPNRITRAETGGRSNGVILRLRSWKETNDVVVSLDRLGQAWMPRPTSVNGVLSVEVALRPMTFFKDGMPTLVTYEMWQAGDLPPAEHTVSFKANCAQRDPAAPSYRKRPADFSGS